MRPLLLLLSFLIMPIAEIYVILQVGGWIGMWPTVGLLVAESILGGWIIKYEGRRAWGALQRTLSSGAMPDRELADAGLILVGGTLLLTPGFVTDVFGFLFVLPFTRPLVRRIAVRTVSRRMRATISGYGPTAPGGYQHTDSRVVTGHIVNDSAD